MYLIGILVVALWAAPMSISMACDRDHSATLGGVMLSNAALFGTMWLFTKFASPPSAWWAVLLAPVFAVIYFGTWYLFSDQFSRMVRDILKPQKS